MIRDSLNFVSPTNGLVFHYAVIGGINAQRFDDFLAQTRLNLDPDEHAIFFYDGAPAHNNPAIPGPNTELKKLPPYSPFLNIAGQAISSSKAAIKADISCPEIQEQMNNRRSKTPGNCSRKLSHSAVAASPTTKHWYHYGNGIVLCKRICHDASTMKPLRDKSFSEFDIRSFKNKCYYDCNVCLTALKTVTSMEMIV